MSQTKSHTYTCRLVWTGAQQGSITDYQRYSREYQIEVAGKDTLTGTSDPAFRGDAGLWNPEDWLVAALVGCHFLSYAALCARGGIEVVHYEDQATGIMEMDPQIKTLRFIKVMLNPIVTLAKGANVERARSYHRQAHKECFIANSVNFPVFNEPTIVVQ